MFRFFFSFFSFLISLALISILLSPPRADAACIRAPTWIMLGQTDGPTYVTYHLRLRNNCAGTNNFRIRVSQLPTSPRVLHASWQVKRENGQWGPENTMINRNVQGAENIDIRVNRDINYYHPDGSYTPVTFRAALDSNTSINDTISTNYVVVNRPDLVITNFVFPGGPTCERADVRITIRNIGWQGFGGNFVVRVNNGNGNYKDHTVSQYVSARESINLNSQFQNRPRPYARSAPWTANAYVDRNYNIHEQDESNNQASDNYNSTSCSPIGWHDSSNCSVSRGWTCDPDDYSRSLTVHFYEGGTFLGSTIANAYRPDVPAAGFCGGNARVGFSFATPASLKDGNPHTITAYAINIGSGGGNPALNGTPKTIVCSPPATPTTPPDTGTYTISGGVFEDTDTDGTPGRKDATEDYTSGNIEIRKDDATNALVYSGSSAPGSGFTSDPLPEGTYRIIFTSYQTLPAGFFVTYPVPAPFTAPAIIVTTGAGCTTSSSSPISCNSGYVTNVNFGIGPEAGFAEPWIHAFGGDIRYHPFLRNIIPDPYFFSEDSSGDPTVTSTMSNGVVFGDELELGGSSPAEKANSESWLVSVDESSFITVTAAYNYLREILRKSGKLRNPKSIVVNACDLDSSASNCELIDNLTGDLYTQDDDTTLNGSSYTFNDGNYIFLINGDLTINHNISVTPGSTVLFIVNGSITIGENVTRVEGIYSAAENFEISESDQQLIIEGSVIANAHLGEGDFINGRDLGENNETTSSIKFIFRPDFILNMPELIRYPSYVIKEVAPGSKVEF